MNDFLFTSQTSSAGRRYVPFGEDLAVRESSPTRDLALCNQVKPQMYFERPLHYYLNLGFQNGFVLDGFEERVFPPDHPQTSPLGWGGKFSEIPMALVARLRKS
jgi:hypothetical protein